MGRMNLISCLLPDPAVVRLETWGTGDAPPTVSLTLASRRRLTACPLCSWRAGRIHSWYVAHPGRPALGRARRCHPAPRPTPVLRQCRVQAPHLQRTPAGRRSAVGAQDSAAVRAACGGGPGTRRRSRRAPRPPHGAGRKPEHPAASGPAGAHAPGGHTDGAGRGRLGPAQAAHLRHGAGRPRPPPPDRASAQPRGRHPCRLAAASIQASRWSREIAPAPMPREAAMARPRRCRSPTASTCCRTWPRRWSWRSPAMPGNCGMRSRRGASIWWPRVVRCGRTRHPRRSGRWPWPRHDGSSAWRRTGRCATCTARVGRERGSPVISASGARPPIAISGARRSLSARVAATPGAARWIHGASGSSSAGTGGSATAVKPCATSGPGASTATTQRCCAISTACATRSKARRHTARGHGLDRLWSQRQGRC